MTPEELHACYATNHRRLYLVALAITMDRQTAEDAVHDTLEKLLRHPREPTDLLSYVTRAVRNTAIDLMRRRRIDVLPADDLLVAKDGDSCEISPAMLAAAFSRLSRDETEAIWLHIYADLPAPRALPICVCCWATACSFRCSISSRRTFSVFA